MKSNYLYSFFFILILISSSCTQFYRINKNVPIEKYDSKSSNYWKWLNRSNYLVIHYKGELLELHDVEYDSKSNTITAETKRFTGVALQYYNKVKEDNDQISRRKISDKLIETHQIHFYVNDAVSDEDSKIVFSLEEIRKIEVTKQAVGVNGLLGLGVTSVALVGGAFLLLYIACNCPHVYIDNGTKSEHTVSLFTGAVAEQLERYDYKQIPDYFKDSSSYKMEVVNELEENQFTNLLELLVINHSKDFDVLADQQGNLYSIKNPILPKIALDNKGNNILNQVVTKDEISYKFDSDSIQDLSEIYLSFDAVETEKQGKLILNIKNTIWSGYVYEKFNALFGKNYSKWAKQNINKSKEERENWMRQEGIKLLVDIKTEKGWEQLDEINLVGEINFNSLVVPLNKVKSKQIDIRIRSGFMFWEIDYAALDFSKNENLNIQVVKPTVLSDKNIETALNEDDKKYLISKDKSTTSIIFNKLNTDKLSTRTLILKSKGYYTSNKEYDGKTARKELQKFKTPGEFSRYSQKLYLDILNQKAMK